MKFHIYCLSLIAIMCFATKSQAAHLIDFSFPLTVTQTNPTATFPGGSTLPSALAMVQVDTTANTISWDIDYQDLTGSLTAAHFHGAAIQGSNASVQVSIINSAQPAAGNLTGSASITELQEADVLAGLWYVNFHTAANGSGELRGQVVNVPEPSSTVLMIAGALALILKNRKQR